MLRDTVATEIVTRLDSMAVHLPTGMDYKALLVTIAAVILTGLIAGLIKR